MNQLGLGVMIGMLSGSKGTIEAFNSRVGKTIKALCIVDNSLEFSFTDDSRLQIYDDGQSCCETRYLTCDDELSYFAGAILQGAEVVDVNESREAAYDSFHEVSFLKVTTSKGVFTVETHVEHNGYYGGFFIVANAH